MTGLKWRIWRGKEKMSDQYHHGGDIYEHPDVLDFSVNINPLGMPLTAYRAAALSIDKATAYPDWNKRELTDALAFYYGEQGIFLKKNQIVWGNGAAELIYALCEERMLSQKHLRAFIPSPTFSAYEEAVRAVGGSLAERPEDADLVFVCNPNNPTGEMWTEEKLRGLAKICQRNGSLFCVDESFLPFVDRPEEKSAIRFQNSRTVVLRSLTKIYGMPGLRLGYLICPDEGTADGIRSLLQPWNVSGPAEAAGAAALRDEAFPENTRIYIRREREYLLRILQEAGISVRDGAANFLLFEADEAFADRLLEKGIEIRRCGDIRGLTSRHFRIGVRTHEENVKFAEAVAAIRG